MKFLLLAAVLSTAPVAPKGCDESSNDFKMRVNASMHQQCVSAGGEPITNDPREGWYVGCDMPEVNK